MTYEELKPCLFCGGAFKMGQEPHDNHPFGGMFYIYHEYGPIGSSARKCPIKVERHFHTKAEAIAAWNTRADDDRIEALTAENERLREALREIASDDFGLQGLIEDGVYEETETSRYYATLVSWRRKRALAALEKQP